VPAGVTFREDGLEILLGQVAASVVAHCEHRPTPTTSTCFAADGVWQSEPAPRGLPHQRRHSPV